MPSREDETERNIKHPITCSCPECLSKKKRVKYPYPADIECPACGNISMYYSDELGRFRCIHESCQAEGKTLEEISDRKAERTKQLKGLWEQLK